MRRRAPLLAAAFLVLASVSCTTPQAGPDGGQAVDAGPTSVAGAGPGGSSFASGAATALWLGAPDDASTTVVDLFSSDVPCATLQQTGWDARVPNGTQILEMKLFGTGPATFQVTSSHTPAPGEASVNHTLAATSGPTETAAGAGSITLTALTGHTEAAGSFDVHWGENALSGTFAASFCAGGHEP